MKHYTINSPIGEVRLEWEQKGTLANILLPSRKTSKDRCGGRAPAWLKPLTDSLKAYFAGKPVTFDLSILDLTQFTKFRQKVYQAAIAIPAGKTMSYGELAAAAGKPKAARAVGTAMSSNPYPIVIPCHRVLAAGGKLGGYGGGLDMKRWLLRHEAAECPGRVAAW